MTLRTASRIGALLALTLGSVAGASIAVAPAQAQTLTTCGDVFSYHLNAPTSITASNGYVCDYRETPENVQIYRDGQLVAGGNGSTYYLCQGSAVNTFVIEGAGAPGAGPFSLDCG